MKLPLVAMSPTSIGWYCRERGELVRGRGGEGRGGEGMGGEGKEGKGRGRDNERWVDEKTQTL